MLDGRDRRLEMTICCVFFLARCSRFCVEERWNTWFSACGAAAPLLFLPSANSAPIPPPPAIPMAPPGGSVALLNSILECCGETGGVWKLRKDLRLLSCGWIARKKGM